MRIASLSPEPNGRVRSLAQSLSANGNGCHRQPEGGSIVLADLPMMAAPLDPPCRAMDGLYAKWLALSGCKRRSKIASNGANLHYAGRDTSQDPGR